MRWGSYRWNNLQTKLFFVGLLSLTAVVAISILAAWSLESEVIGEIETDSSITTIEQLEAATSLAADRAPAALADYEEIIRRPLFTPGRKPPSKPEETIAQDIVPLDGYVLVGILNEKGNARALLQNANGETSRVIAGDMLQQWKVKEVQRDRVIFIHGQSEQMVVFFGSNASGL